MDLEDLERQIQRAVSVRAVPSWHHVEKFEVEPGSPQKIEQNFPVPRRGQIVECIVAREDPLGDRAPWATAHMLPQRTFQVDLANGSKFLGQTVRARLLDVRRSVAVGEVLTGAALKAAINGAGDGRGERPGPVQQDRGGRAPAPQTAPPA